MEPLTICFGVQIRENPHMSHHKFVEFYDVRAAETALRALNRSDIAGKQIKLEPGRPGGSKRWISSCSISICLHCHIDHLHVFS